MSQPKRVTPSPADVSFKGAFEKGAINENQKLVKVSAFQGQKAALGQAVS